MTKTCFSTLITMINLLLFDQGKLKQTEMKMILELNKSDNWKPSYINMFTAMKLMYFNAKASNWQ